MDGEFGGLEVENSLLTMYYGYYDSNFNLIDELDLSLMPEDGIYKVTPEALRINQIDLVALSEKAITYKQGGTELYKFLKYASEDYGSRLIPVGHFLKLDVAHTTSKLVSPNTWGNFVSFREIDTGTIAQFLRTSGKLPLELSVGLSSLVDYFGIKVEGKPHEAKYDATTSILLLKELQELVK